MPLLSLLRDKENKFPISVAWLADESSQQQRNSEVPSDSEHREIYYMHDFGEKKMLR